MSRGDKPAYNVRARQEPKSDYLTTVGSAWKFREGDGYVVRIHSPPVDWDGSFILVKPLESESAQTTESK
jgi:hypothetical protein